jgi:hypothetical protein
VFSEYIPELVFAVNEIDGAATVPFPARNVPIVSRCRREIVLFATIERVESGLHVRVTRDIQNAGSSQIALVIRLLYMFVFVASVKDTLDPFADMLKLVVFSEYIPELVFAVNEIDGAATFRSRRAMYRLSAWTPQ